MPLLLDMKNAISLMRKGEWREFVIRLKVYLGQVDLKDACLDELGLSEERSYYYAHSGGLHLEEVLKTLNITARDSIVDFGSGKGGVLITLSKYPFLKITGVEISPALVSVAKKNLKALKIRDIEIVLSDAADFTDLEENNYFYFFNPFPCNVMRAVIENISLSLIKKPRKATLIYYNPECHDSVVTGTPFVKINEFRLNDLSCYIYSNETPLSEPVSAQYR